MQLVSSMTGRFLRNYSKKILHEIYQRLTYLRDSPIRHPMKCCKKASIDVGTYKTYRCCSLPRTVAYVYRKSPHYIPQTSKGSMTVLPAQVTKFDTCHFIRYYSQYST